VGFCLSHDEKFEFFLTPGTYSLEAYGPAIDHRVVTITLPPDRLAFALDPIAIPALALEVLKGRVAPELEDVVGWKGKPVKLSDLKGKYVLLEFWGDWCASCIASMPVLIELHEKYADKGLAIVGVHVDKDGEVDTAAKLDDKISGFRKQLWKGKDIPFPVALASGKRFGEDAKRGGPPAQYGIPGFPTGILIDRDGKVVGLFQTHDIKKASEEIEKLLAKKEPR
jgi:thiol-disulfide isomerase/thioredoxin